MEFRNRVPSGIAAAPIDGIVLRYGYLYAAASAAVLAIEKARRGIYNIAEPSGYLSTEKARRELGFDASVRLNAAA